jgi:hypothetical protein
VKTMTEVLSEHWSASTHTERKPFVDKCDGCGDVIFSWGDPTVADGSERLAAHQSDALTAAGFGLVADAWDEGYGKGKRVMVKLMSPTHFAAEEPNPYRARAAAVRGEG